MWATQVLGVWVPPGGRLVARVQRERLGYAWLWWRAMAARYHERTAAAAACYRAALLQRALAALRAFR